VWLRWIHMTWKYTLGRRDSAWHSVWQQPMRQWQHWQGRNKDVGMNYTQTISFLPLNYMMISQINRFTVVGLSGQTGVACHKT
jgi:hypothetical protein